VALTRIISEIIQDNTIENSDISASFSTSISGSRDAASISGSRDAASISGSLGANAGVIRTLSAVTVSGSRDAASISGSFGNQRVGTTDDVKFANITGSNDISASGNLSITGNVDIDGTSNFAGDVTLQNDLVVTGRLTAEEIHTTFISSSITQATGSNIFGDATSDSHQFTGSIDVSGSFTLRDGDMVVSDTLTATNIGAFTAAGAIDFNNENMTNVDIDSGVITGITDLVVADGGTGVSTLTDGGVLLGNGAGVIQAMAVLTDGQMIVGDGTTDPVAESGATLRTSIGVGTTDNVLFANITGSNVSASVGKFTTATINNITGNTTSSGDLGTDGDLYVGGRITGSSGATFVGNVGIGTTAPADILDISQTGNEVQVRLASNSNNTRGFIFANNNNQIGFKDSDGDSVYQTGDNESHIWSTQGSETMRLTAAGRLGIGDASPGSPLDVKSSLAANTANFNSTNGATNITFESGSTLIAQMEFSSTGTSQIVTRTAASLALGVNNSQKLIISGSSGFVGIGEPSPDEMLHLTSTGAVGIKLEADSNNSGQEDAYIILSTDNASIVAELAITSNAGDRITGGLANATILGATTASPVQLFTTDIARLTVAAGGNVGIGTNAPAALLHLNTSDAGSIMRFSRAEGDEALVDNDIVGELEFFANDGSVASNAQTKVGRIFTEISSTALQTNIQFHTFGSSLGERMRINAAGRVGIKEDDPDAFLHVKNAGGATPALKLEDNSSGVNSSYVLMDIDFSNDADIENGKFIIFQDSGGVIGSISGDDDATSFNTSSDYRKKTDLKGIVDATGTINQLKLYDFAWKKNTDKRAVGVIAHEAQEVFPNAVSGEKDAMTTKIYKDENGDKQEKEVMDTQTVDYSKFIPLLLKSIQELTKRIEELEN